MLNALVYEMSTRKMLLARFSVRLDGTRLSADVWGEPVDRPPTDDGWIAQTVVDV